MYKARFMWTGKIIQNSRTFLQRDRLIFFLPKALLLVSTSVYSCRDLITFIFIVRYRFRFAQNLRIILRLNPRHEKRGWNQLNVFSVLKPWNSRKIYYDHFTGITSYNPILCKKDEFWICHSNCTEFNSLWVFQ